MSLKRKSPSSKAVHLKDYRPPSHLVDAVELNVHLGGERTCITAKLQVRANPLASSPLGALVLNGSHFKLESIALNGRKLAPDAFDHHGETLTLHNPPLSAFELETVTLVDPSANKALQGLYLSKGVYCTQCEAEGFRRITPMFDRPDVLARYRVRLEADVKEAPILLANGNLLERGTLPGGRHYAIWDDPHPKPCYLFALVAGDLGSIASQFTTLSGRRVDLRIYVEHGKEPRAAWAMDALKRAMAWDEKRFGREYDLDQFNIVAVSDFNMGAMENKGLNIFNDRLILASAETATDANFEAIESVVAHEYFHNWTGNRITCRDWFQLCLKEGLTVYRDQEFSADERSRTVQRIADVRLLKAAQFPEDAGPLAHPVRPESYIEINNFYTATVYEKGAELVRMIECLLGAANFRAGLDLYFDRHDGQAATVEQFIACFEDASGQSLADFMTWYRQAGTPRLEAQTTFDRKSKTLTLHLRQTIRESGKGTKTRAVPIPVQIGLVGRGGREEQAELLVLRDAEATYRFDGYDARPVASILRGFSAPVALSTNHTDADLAFLTVNDSDLFNRWQSAQQLALRTLLHLYASLANGKRSSKGATLAKAIAAAIADTALEPAYRAELLRLPSAADVMQAVGRNVDPALAIRAHRQLIGLIARTLGPGLEVIYAGMRPRGPYSPVAKSAGRRALRNGALSLLTARGQAADLDRLSHHYSSATNMTDQAHALALLAHTDTPERAKALETFLARWKDDDLVIDIWFSVQAQSMRAGAFEDIVALVQHPLFKFTAPNKVRALIGTFAALNLHHFHRADGAGYDFVAGHVLAIDRFNPQIASRLISSFRSWRTLTPALRSHARAALKRVLAAPGLSRDVEEMASRMLDATATGA